MQRSVSIRCWAAQQPRRRERKEEQQTSLLVSARRCPVCALLNPGALLRPPARPLSSLLLSLYKKGPLWKESFGIEAIKGNKKYLWMWQPKVGRLLIGPSGFIHPDVCNYEICRHSRAPHVNQISPAWLFCLWCTRARFSSAQGHCGQIKKRFVLLRAPNPCAALSRTHIYIQWRRSHWDSRRRRQQLRTIVISSHTD